MTVAIEQQNQQKKIELSVKLGGGGEGEEFIAEIRNVILLDPK